MEMLIVANDLDKVDIDEEVIKKILAPDIVLASDIYKAGILKGIDIVKAELTKSKEKG